MKTGPSFGYYPEPAKSYLVIHDNFSADAHEIFDGLGVNTVKSHRLLVRVTGNTVDREEYMNDCVKNGTSDDGCSYTTSSCICCSH